MTRKVTVSVAALVAVVLLAGGVIAGAFLVPEPVPTAAVAAGSNASITVSSETYDGSHEVSATPAFAPALHLNSPQTGVVTASACSAGGSVSSGDVFFEVAGQPVLAVATATPLWRDLAVGTKGKDVSALQNELTRLGHAVPASGAYDSATAKAVDALLAAKTVPTAPGGGLPLADLVWLPAQKVDVASCAFDIGDSVTAGQPVAQLAGALQSLTLVNPPSGADWVARAGKVSVPLDSSGLIKSQDFLAAVEALPIYKALQRAASAGGASGSGTGSGPSTIPVTVALKTPEKVVVVPPSAVIAAGEGRGCLISQGHQVKVSIVSSSLGQTMVSVPDGVSVTRVVRTPPATAACK